MDRDSRLFHCLTLSRGRIDEKRKEVWKFHDENANTVSFIANMRLLRHTSKAYDYELDIRIKVGEIISWFDMLNTGKSYNGDPYPTFTLDGSEAAVDFGGSRVRGVAPGYGKLDRQGLRWNTAP